MRSSPSPIEPLGGQAPDPGAPRTETERRLLAIWTSVLEADGIGVHDDFFGVGGDSLAAMRCINRISAAFGFELPLDLFLVQSAPIADVAAAIDRLRTSAAGDGARPSHAGR